MQLITPTTLAIADLASYTTAQSIGTPADSPSAGGAIGEPASQADFQPFRGAPPIRNPFPDFLPGIMPVKAPSQPIKPMTTETGKYEPLRRSNELTKDLVSDYSSQQRARQLVDPLMYQPFFCWTECTDVGPHRVSTGNGTTHGRDGPRFACKKTVTCVGDDEKKEVLASIAKLTKSMHEEAEKERKAACIWDRRHKKWSPRNSADCREKLAIEEDTIKLSKLQKKIFWPMAPPHQ